jgi:hypothetical protein
MKIESDRTMLEYATNELKNNLKAKKEMNNKDFKRQSKHKLKELATNLSKSEI